MGIRQGVWSSFHLLRAVIALRKARPPLTIYDDIITRRKLSRIEMRGAVPMPKTASAAPRRGRPRLERLAP